jgi:hypothetical protein
VQAYRKKISNFLNKSSTERERNASVRVLQFLVARFGAKVFNRGLVFLAYHPDAHIFSSAHSELDQLFKKFTEQNAYNNGGDLTRLWSLLLNIKQVLSEGVEGDFAELGVWRGNTAAVLAHYAAQAGRQIFLFDTFEGFDQKDIEGVDRGESARYLSDTSLELVKRVVGDAGSACHFIKGYFPESIPASAVERKYSVVSLDCDLYKPMKAGLEFFYPRMSHGGIFFLHDYSSPFWDGAKKAIDEFCKATGECLILLPDKSGSAVIRKTRGAASA